MGASHVEGDLMADGAAKAVLQLPISIDIQISYTDLKYTNNTYFTESWHNCQVHYNKFQMMIKPIVGETKL